MSKKTENTRSFIPPKKGYALDMSEKPELLNKYKENETQELRIVGVRFGASGRVFDFNAKDFSLELDSPVIAEVPEKGLMLGWVAKPPLTVDNSGLGLTLRHIVRIATEKDVEEKEQLEKLEESAVEKVQKLIGKYKLAMQTLRVEYTLDRRKVLVYFASEGRVDFRDLLKELVHTLKARVELRQVGVRDQTKMKGAIGPCGEEVCCSRFMNRFHAVSIKMAKDQDLSLKPTKVSGMCGRLKCCLAYENRFYQDAKRKAPARGKCVKCKSGSCGTVQEVDVLREKVKIRLDDGQQITVDASEIIEVTTMNPRRQHRNEKVVATTDEDLLRQQIDDETKKESN